MRNSDLTQTILLLVLGLGVVLTGYLSRASHAAPALPEPLAQIQVVMVNDAPNDTPTIEQLEIKRAVDAIREPGRIGMQLFNGDEVTTGTGVEVSLLYTTSAPETHVQVLMQEKSHARIDSLWAYVGKFLISGWGAFDTKTQNVRLAKKATEFYIDVAEDGSVDLKVLRGEVEVETTEDQPPQGLDYSHRRSMPEKMPVGPLHGLKVEKGQRLSTPRKLHTEEVDSILVKTDKILVATLAATTPLNVIPTSYEVDTADRGRPDPQQTKALAAEAYTKARRRATLNPTAENIASLGDAYKDLGAGKRAVKEYDEALKLNPTLENSISFLASQSEAYRLTGDLKTAAEKSDLAVKKIVSTAQANRFDKRLAFNARGNVTYALAAQYVAFGKWDIAHSYFTESKASFGFATTIDPDKFSWVVNSNLLNASLAIGPDPAVRPELSRFMGTYRGRVSFPGAGIEGAATLILSGNRFTLINCDETISGSILWREPAAEGLDVDLLFDSSAPIKKLSLKVTMPAEKRIELTNVATEKNRFTFSTAVKQYALRCVRIYKLAP